MKYVYVVEMCRWADRENHSYCIGAFSTLLAALAEGLQHAYYRDCKYEPTVSMFEVDHATGNSLVCTNLERANQLYLEIKGKAFEDRL